MVGSFRVRGAALAAVVLGGALASVVLGWVGGASARGVAGRSVGTVGRPPRTLATFASVTGNSRFRLELRSVASGRVTKVLANLGASWTNNGFALSPDGRYVYFTLIPKSPKWTSLLLEEISTSTDKRRFIGRGEQPALTPNARLLAYATGQGHSASIVVRDLASGSGHSINVSRLLGSRNDMLNASLAWLGDGRQLAVFETCCFIAASGDADGRAARSGYHLIVVSVSRRGSLSARRVSGPGAHWTLESVTPDPTKASSVLAAWFGRGGRAMVDRLTFGSPRTTVKGVIAIANALVQAFDPTGQRLLYLLGSRPPNLWTATIQSHRLIDRRLLIANSKLDAVAW